jgi:NADH-quinone oxidoreductase subunit A
VFLDYHAVLVFLIAGAAMVCTPLLMGFLFRPKNPYPAKNMAYECAEDPVGKAQVRFDMRFYSTALIFIIFEVEIALMFPWAHVFATAPNRALALGAGLIFIAIVFLGLVVDWVKGDLDWVKTFRNIRRVQD